MKLKIYVLFIINLFLSSLIFASNPPQLPLDIPHIKMIVDQDTCGLHLRWDDDINWHRKNICREYLQTSNYLLAQHLQEIRNYQLTRTVPLVNHYSTQPTPLPTSIAPHLLHEQPSVPFSITQNIPTFQPKPFTPASQTPHETKKHKREDDQLPVSQNSSIPLKTTEEEPRVAKRCLTKKPQPFESIFRIRQKIKIHDPSEPS